MLIESELRSQPFSAWNTAVGGGGNSKMKHSDETRAKISKAIKAAFVLKPQVGHPVSEATKLKLSKSKTGIKLSEATKAGLLNFINS